MKYSEAYSSEKRNEDNLFEIRLYLEGEWWRAYEWSAFLAAHLKSVSNPLKPTKRNWSKDKNGIVLVGLKTSSLKKYFPSLNVDDLSLDEKEIVISCKEMFDEFNIDNYNDELIKWKSNLDFKEKDNLDIPSDKIEKPINYDKIRYKEILEAQNKILEGIIQLNKIIGID